MTPPLRTSIKTLDVAKRSMYYCNVHMPKALSHSTRWKRTFYGEAPGRRLVDWLNQVPPWDREPWQDTQRVIRLLDRISALTRASAYEELRDERKSQQEREGPMVSYEVLHGKKRKRKGRLFIPGAEATSVRWEGASAERLFRRAPELARFRGKTFTSYAGDPNKEIKHAGLLMQVNAEIACLFSGTVPALSVQVGEPWLIAWSYGKNPGAGMRMAAHSMVQLAELGRLPRVRRCKVCSRWLYARFEHEWYCSTKCQQKYNSSKEEVKKRRNEILRERRAAARAEAAARRKAAQ